MIEKCPMCLGSKKIEVIDHGHRVKSTQDCTMCNAKGRLHIVVDIDQAAS